MVQEPGIWFLTANTLQSKCLVVVRKKTDSALITLYWGTYVKPLLPWIGSKYHIFRVCACSLRCPACNARDPYCHLWPVWLYKIFAYCLINVKIKKKVIEHKMCFNILLTVHLNILFININQLDALNFIISLFQAFTGFEHMCCIIQFCPPDDEHMCSKHVEAWNKLIIKFSASSWLILINNVKCVSWFSLRLLLRTFLVPRRTERDMIQSVYWFSCKAPAILVTF